MDESVESVDSVRPMIEVFPSSSSSPQPIAYRPVKAPVTPRPAGSVEQTIGLRWSGWIGAIILVIGAGMGIKFAYDNGWFGTIPPIARVILLSLAGFTLIGLGEWVFRKINVLSAVGLFGAGVAILFIDSYAGFRFYNLYGRQTAFVLMAVSTFVGAGVAMRGRLVSIGVLSLLGGYLAPMLLAGPINAPAVFYLYLVLLQIVALTLAWRGGGPKWWSLRSLALLATIVWAVIFPGTSDSRIPFYAVVAALFQTELLLSSRPILKIEGNASVGQMFSMCVTAFLAAGLLVALRTESDAVRGMWIVGLAVVCATVAFAISHRPGGWKALGVGFRIQAAGLIILAVPIYFSGVSIEIAWALLAVCFALMGMLENLEIARGSALGIWCLAAGHLISRYMSLGQNGGELAIFSLHISSFVRDAWGLALAGQVIAICSGRGRDHKDQLAGASSLLASLLFVGATLSSLEPLSATLMLVLYVWVLMSVDVVSPRTRAIVQAAAILICAAMKWAVVDLLAARLSSRWLPAQYPAVFNPAMAVGGFLAVTLAGIAILRRRRLMELLQRWGAGPEVQRSAAIALTALVIAILTIGLSFDVDRVVELRSLAATALWPNGQLKQFLWTILWSAASVGFALVVHRAEPAIPQRQQWMRIPNGLIALLAVKFLLLDVLSYRVGSAAVPATVIFNVQVIAAMLVVGSLVTVMRIGLWRGFQTAGPWLIILTLLITGGMEIDRGFERLAAAGTMTRADADFARQVALSIYCGVAAISSVVAGFRLPSTTARYCGLALFGITLTKVLLIDLQDAGQGYRILSFIAVGLLLLGTSVLYGKLTPKLLEHEPAENPN